MPLAPHIPAALRVPAAVSVVALAVAGMFAAEAGAKEVPVAVPSGKPVSLVETIWPGAEAEPGARILRLRFLAPWIAASSSGEPGGIGIDVAEIDMEFLCNAVALPALASAGREADQIVISLMAAPVDFGEAAPEVTQFFDAYRVEEGKCVWEGL
ncbi:DUF6497 family protein [Acidimangrovimonas pyrenivorans]|uniref:DUF6497 family protein n=1 Tax=Acidimangrovimonas pyrenivorans TaxID=2030798 RepID=A0ABV7AHV1_9RHOB